jgi:hypothetical protein
MAKFDKMANFVPSVFNPYNNTYVKGLLYAWSSEDDKIVAAVQDAKEQLFVKYAQLRFLDALGSNVGVFRPAAVNLADTQYRELIPALSFRPKQVIPTIIKVLEVFFGQNNPRVFVKEINPNEIVIQIPSSVPALRRDLKGSHHFRACSGVIQSIDVLNRELTVDFDSPFPYDSKNYQEDELRGADFGQGNLRRLEIMSNSSGRLGVILQFPLGTDVSVFTVGARFNIANVPNYVGSFIPDLRRLYTVRSLRGTLGQNIVAGTIYTILTMSDASSIPDQPGRLIFNFGRSGEEADIKYFGRPNNTTLLIDPAYTFQKNHSIGDVVNVIAKPYEKPAIEGDDYSVYLVGVTAARILAQKIVESVVAAGVVIRWQVAEPRC